MTNEQLALAAKTDPAVIPELWSAVRRLIGQWALRYLPPDGSTARYDMDDLIQAGYFGLLSAVDAYPENCKFKFNTYLSRHCRNQFRAVLGIRTSKREVTTVSLDTPIGDEGDMTLRDAVPDPTAAEAFEEAEHRLYLEGLSAALARAMELLPERQADVVQSRYFDGETLAEVGDRLGLSRERVRAIERECLKAMRTGPRYTVLKQFDYRAEGLRGTGLSSFRRTRTSATEAAALRLMEMEARPRG